jgi:phospholipid/cholesterol/gamma-HCH transport system permease protein
MPSMIATLPSVASESPPGSSSFPDAEPDTRRPGGASRLLAYLREAPVRSLATIGRSAELTAAVVRYAVVDTVRLRLPVYEILDQTWNLLKVTALPALLMAIPIGGEVAVQVGGIMNQVGANSLAGAGPGCADGGGDVDEWCGGIGDRLRSGGALDP